LEYRPEHQGVVLAAPFGMSDIFISYRHQDSQGSAGRLADTLKVEFAQSQIFRDIETPESKSRPRCNARSGWERMSKQQAALGFPFCFANDGL
jgi:hypothetical protein